MICYSKIKATMRLKKPHRQDRHLQMGWKAGGIVRKKLTAGDVERLLSKPDPSCFFITAIATYLTILALKI